MPDAKASELRHLDRRQASPIVAALDAHPRRGRLMSGIMKPLCRKILLYGIVVGLGLTACTDFKKDFLCRPAGHCVDAADGGTGSN